ncbi:13713_t:CDS:1, partial [Racocetra persica]
QSNIPDIAVIKHESTEVAQSIGHEFHAIEIKSMHVFTIIEKL